MKTWFLRSVALLALAVLGACGGGGGGGGGFFPITGVPGATTVTLSGNVTFDSVPNATGGLNYGAMSAKPVRGAVVEILGTNGAVLASTTYESRPNFCRPAQGQAGTSACATTPRARLSTRWRVGASPLAVLR
jgi:hypothetical protein